MNVKVGGQPIRVKDTHHPCFYILSFVFIDQPSIAVQTLQGKCLRGYREKLYHLSLKRHFARNLLGIRVTNNILRMKLGRCKHLILYTLDYVIQKLV